MNYEQFMECVRTRVEEVLGGEARVTVYSVVKNNSVKLDGLTIMERENEVMRRTRSCWNRCRVSAFWIWR